MESPEELLYTKKDEWIRKEGDIVMIGITSFAQSELGDIVIVEIPKPDHSIKKIKYWALLK